MIKHQVMMEIKVAEFSSKEEAESYALNKGISLSQIVEVDVPSAPLDMQTIVDNKIMYFQSVAPQLVRELYVTNTLSGITTIQSDQMFDDFADVLIRIKEGAFPTALYRLSQKQPTGFVTQALIDSWRAKVISYMV